jgi:hypothetical protein
MCHGQPRFQHVDLTAGVAYNHLINTPTLYSACSPNVMVRPGDPAHSDLVSALTGSGVCASFIPPMPQYAAALSSTEIQTLREWICEGAPNN